MSLSHKTPTRDLNGKLVVPVVIEPDDSNKQPVKTYGENPTLQESLLPVSGSDTNNTPTALLGASQNFTGAWVECSKYNSIAVTILTDVVSQIDGARIEFAKDAAGTEIVRTIKTTVIPTLDGLFFSVPVEGSYYRINYTNNVFPQTVFRVDIQLKTSEIGSSTLPLNAPLTDENSVPVTRAIITGRGVADNYFNQRASDVSMSNSTATPLLADENFTGAFEEATGFANISVILNTDQDSAENGLRIEWSTDGISVDDHDDFTITASLGDGGKSFTFGVISRFYRVSYDNGPVDQTSFKLQTMLHIARPKPSSHRIEGDINGQNDAELVKSVITGRDANGVFVNKRTSGVLNANSTTTLLGVGQAFVGDWFDLSEYGGITCSLFSDVDGNVKFEHSHDAISVIDNDNFNTTGGEAFFTGVAPISRYVRINYTNGVTPQSQFTLQTIATTEQLGPSTQPINSTLESNSVAVTTRSVLTGFDVLSGQFNNIGSVDGRLQVESVTLPQVLGNKFTRFARNGGSNDLNVNGSLVSPVEFLIPADVSGDLLVDSLAFTAFSGGIKIDKFLSQNSELANGIIVEIKSQDSVFQFEPIKNTLNFDFLFAGGPARSFNLIFASGNDSLVAVYGPSNPFIIKKQGTFGTDDYIKVIIQDNLSSISRLRFVADGRVDL